MEETCKRLLCQVVSVLTTLQDGVTRLLEGSTITTEEPALTIIAFLLLSSR